MTAYVKVPLRLIRPGRNIRSDLELPGIEDLAESIRALGVLQPITLIPRGTGYEIVFGHRRLAAARKAGLAEIPAIVLPSSRPRRPGTG